MHIECRRDSGVVEPCPAQLGFQVLAHLRMPPVGGEQVLEHLPCPVYHPEVGIGEARRHYHLPAGDDAARLQDAHHLGKHGLGVRYVQQHVVAVSDIEEPVLEGHVCRVPDLEYDVALSHIRRQSAPHTHLRLLDVDAVEFARVHCARQPYCHRPGSASEVQNAHARLEVGHQVRVHFLRVATHQRVEHLLAVAYDRVVRMVGICWCLLCHFAFLQQLLTIAPCHSERSEESQIIVRKSTSIFRLRALPEMTMTACAYEADCTSGTYKLYDISRARTGYYVNLM